MADKGSQEELTLRRMPDGGYLVAGSGRDIGPSMMVFASTSITEALEYMRGQIEPVRAKGMPVGRVDWRDQKRKRAKDGPFASPLGS